jgi:hypothetical protein
MPPGVKLSRDACSARHTTRRSSMCTSETSLNMIAMIPFFQSCLGLLRGREVACSKSMRDTHCATTERPMGAVYHIHGILVRTLHNVFVKRMMGRRAQAPHACRSYDFGMLPGVQAPATAFVYRKRQRHAPHHYKIVRSILEVIESVSRSVHAVFRL